MKKTIVALAVAAFAATSANAATVFNQDGTKVDVNGSFRALVVKEKAKRTDIGTGGSHFAFEASHNLGNGLSALGYAKVKLDTDTTLDTLYAGFDFDGVGKLTFGKQSTIGDDLGVADYTYALDGVNKVKGAGDKVVKFTSADFGGFTFGVDYTFAGSAEKENFNNRAVTLGAFYNRTFGDVKFAFEAGLSNEKLAEKNTQKAFTVATEVGYGPVSFGIDYTQSKVKTKEVKTVELFGQKLDSESTDSLMSYKEKALLLGVKYQVTDAVKVYANYETHKLSAKNQPSAKAQEYALGVGYKLHKNVETFVEGAKYRIKFDGESSSHNKVQAGFRVHF